MTPTIPPIPDGFNADITISPDGTIHMKLRRIKARAAASPAPAPGPAPYAAPLPYAPYELPVVPVPSPCDPYGPFAPKVNEPVRIGDYPWTSPVTVCGSGDQPDFQYDMFNGFLERSDLPSDPRTFGGAS